MWEIDIKFQLLTFLFACILGALYSAFYDLFRALRLVKNQKPFTIFLEDLFYFITLAFITFFYLLAFTNGEVRFYVIIGIVLGFLVFYILLSKYNLLLLKCLFKIIFNGINLFFKGLYWLINKIDNISSNFFKKCLKMASKVLYNNKS